VIDKMLALTNSSKEGGPLVKKQDREREFNALKQELSQLVQASEKQGSTLCAGSTPSLWILIKCA
jgi:hypothetical protein